MINQQRYNSLGTEHQQPKRRDNRTSHKCAVEPCVVMLHNNDKADLNR